MLRANTWIVVPLYNEAPVVRATIERLLPIGGNIVIVDDGSTDGGPELFAGLDVNPPSPQPSPVKGEGECRSQEASHSTGDSPRVTLIQHPFNLGQGAALSTGFQYALSLGAEFLATFDSDGQYLPEDLASVSA